MTSRDEFRVRLANWPRDRGAIRQVRETVFIHEQKVPAALEWDGQDDDGLHALAHDPQQRAIATGRLLPTGQLGRMAVVRSWRGRGVGDSLLNCLLGEAHRRGLKEVFLHAQLRVVDFYRRSGFTPEGGVFMEANIPHQTMRLVFEEANQ
jgi:predicted GNAT family N-acyltransferase